MSQKIRSLVLILALALLFVSSAYAAPAGSRPAGRPAVSFLAVAWNWIASFLPWTVGIGEKAGSQMDPNGEPQQSTILSIETTNAGSQMDPNG